VAKYTAVFDACVLYPAPLRDLLMSVAMTEQFRAKWTDEIQNEWMRNLLAKREDLTEVQLQRTVELMNQSIPDCLVENYEEFKDSLELPDPGDHHVLAAAIKCQADVIVTNNLKDFPQAAMDKYHIDVQSPDVFLNHLFDLNPVAFCKAVHGMRKRLHNPEQTAEELLRTFYKQGLPMTVNKLKSVIEII
jgi:predicted nucleic acid-binding protein